MSSPNLSSSQRLWSRILRNAATLARLRVLKCLKEGSCRDVVGTGAGGDITKQFDFVAEQTMIEYLEPFSAFTLVSEEAGMKTIGAKPQGFLIMDPIDGSTNISHDISFACIAIAYATELTFDALEVAIVLDLFSGSCYYASKGAGAFQESHPISPAKQNPSKISLVGVDTTIPPEKLGRSSKIKDAESIKYTRHYGANALELCYVADGSLDGFIDLRGVFRGTDLAAASLILKEAGAVLIDEHGRPIKGECSNDARYSYIAARDETFAKELLTLASE